MNSIKVLCVENPPEYMDVLKSMLECAGYQVMEASTGGVAVQVLTDEPVNGVLLEYDLPDATGTAVRAEMRRIKPEVPVLLFKGVGSQTPFLLRFFDAYLRSSEKQEFSFGEFNS
jgi:two-component system KDP operon response regulator KdpE